MAALAQDSFHPIGQGRPLDANHGLPLRRAPNISVAADESGQGLRPPKGRTWGRRGRTPVVKGDRTRQHRLIYRTHLDHGHGKHRLPAPGLRARAESG